ncbi:MAG: translocation/assembly module TamB domain-containing protein [Chitinophagales bacterium]|nr:translocation/assembly module TamB domain-containing protein [Chitinophagales bacterium]
MNIAKRIGRIFGYFLLSLLSLLVVVIFLLQLPPVQTFIAQKATNIVSGMTGGKISVGRVAIRFLDNVQLKDIYVEDLEGDTLLYAGKLRVDINLFNLINQRIKIDDVLLDNAVVNLKENPKDSTFNFQFILDAFAGDTTEKDTTPSAWTFGLNTVRLSNIRANIDAPVSGFQLNGAIPLFELDVNKFDMEKQQIRVGEILLQNANVRFALAARDTLIVEKIDTSTNKETGFFIPATGWEVRVDKIDFNNNHIVFDDNGKAPMPNGLDFAHIDADSLTIEIIDVAYIGRSIKAEVKHIGVKEKSGLHLKELKAGLQVDTSSIQLKQLVLQTAQSRLENNTTVRYTDFDSLLAMDSEATIDTRFSNTNISIAEVLLLMPQLADIKYVNPKSRDSVRLEGSISGRIGDLRTNDLLVQLGKRTVLNTTLHVTGLPDFNQAKFDIDLKKLSVDYNDLARMTRNLPIPKEAVALSPVNLSARASGSVRDLKVDNILLTTAGARVFYGNATAKGLPNMDQAYFTLDIKELTAPMKMLASVGVKLPEPAMRLGTVHLKGNFKGTTREMDVYATVSSDIGNLVADLTADFNKDYTDASYEGKVMVWQFDLGRMLADTALGAVTLEAQVKGHGINPDSIKADLDAVVRQIEYNRYTYRNVEAHGRVNGKRFFGKASINDPNLKFDFKGLVNLGDTIPEFRFKASIDTVNLGKLNLVADNLRLSADLEVDFQGLDLDNFEGTAAIKNFNIANDSARYQMDSLVAKAYEEGPRNKVVEVTSPILNASIKGDYKIADLPKLLMNYVNDYFPIDQTVDSTDKPSNLAIEPGPQAAPTDQKFDLLVTMGSPLKLTKIFLPGLTRLDTAYITGNFDSRAKVLNLTAIVPGLEYDSISVDSIYVGLSGQANGLVTSVIIDSVVYGEELNVPRTTLNANMFNNSLDASLNIGGDSASRLNLATLITRNAEGLFNIHLKDSLYIAGEKWTVPINNAIEYGAKKLLFTNVSMTNGEQQIAIQSGQQSKGIPPIDVSFRNFSLSELSEMADYDSIMVEGIMNGKVTLKNLDSKMAFTADLDINDIVFNGDPVGSLALDAGQQGNSIATSLKLTGGENSLAVSGLISTEQSTMDLNVDMARLNLNVADPFLRGTIKDSKGYLSGDLTVRGQFSEPAVNGYIQLNGLSTHVDYVMTRFTFDDGRINISPNSINIPKLVMKDEQQRTATLTGAVSHNNFQNIKLDLDFNAPEFQFMNTTAEDNDLFYGKVILGVNAKIRGNAELPKVDAVVSTKKGTIFNLTPLGMEETVKKENFIIFHSPRLWGEENKDVIVPAKEEYEVQLSGVDLNLEFTLTPDATVNIILDPLAGDSLSIQGSANLVVDLPPAGNPSIVGTFAVEKGNYNFSYQRLIKKPFVIQKGSRIDFSGDPMDARMDITAIYTAQATTYELISNQSASLSTDEVAAAKKRTPINVLLSIRGNLSEPELIFDIKLPEDQTLISSTAARQLSQIRQEPTELNKQVFSLLLFNSFMADQGTGPDLASTGQNVALRSVSNLISNQLNRLANRASGFEINLDVDSYKSKYETQAGNDMVTQVQLDVSKNFFNERLVVTVGSNVNVENNTATSQGGFSNITGDFTVEYKLTPNGRYRVKIFQTSDYDLLNQANLYRTGVGFTYRESFRNLFQKREDDKKAKELRQQPNTEQPK